GFASWTPPARRPPRPKCRPSPQVPTCPRRPPGRTVAGPALLRRRRPLRRRREGRRDRAEPCPGPAVAGGAASDHAALLPPHLPAAARTARRPRRALRAPATAWRGRHLPSARPTPGRAPPPAGRGPERLRRPPGHYGHPDPHRARNGPGAVGARRRGP